MSGKRIKALKKFYIDNFGRFPKREEFQNLKMGYKERGEIYLKEIRLI